MRNKRHKTKKHKEYVKNEIIVQLTNEMTQRKKRKVTQAELHKFISLRKNKVKRNLY